MKFINFVRIDGNLTQDPEVKISKNGKTYCKTGICYNERRMTKNDANEKKFENKPNFFNFTAFDHEAEYLKSCKKGDLVTITGELKQDTWTDSNNEKKSSTVIVVNSIFKICIEKNSDLNDSIDEYPEIDSDINIVM